ncbi:hypothetical protein [Virgibacillus proomii]|nr:hypothetical protein [Virgibacillus proomii]MBU5267882.1 hypothetical protein [Virgibacillus proomii]
MADQAIIRIEYDKEHLEKMGLCLEDEARWLECEDLKISVISVEEI